MNRPAQQPAYDQQFEQELEQASRRSFIALCVCYMGLAVVGMIYAAWTTPDQVWDLARWRVWLRLGLFLAAVTLAACFLIWNRRRQASQAQMMSMVTALIVLLSSTALAARMLLIDHLPDVFAWWLVDLAALHLVACVILPWRPKQCAFPFVPLILLWSGAILIPKFQPGWDIFSRVVAAMCSPAILVPGALIAAWRFKQSEEDFDHQMLGKKVQSIGGELSKARIVHDAMFPKPIDTGHVNFEYEYLPIAEIGGDYVHLHICRATGNVYLTLLDVAGHGLAAALTVNRLFGELERIRAENPDAEPAEVMELLNRYIHLTMAPYSMYATGACMMLVAATGELKWVNAGHPPALLRRTDGSVTDLPGTTMIMGAMSYAEFLPNQKLTMLKPGDTVIAYTDGAFEARNSKGARLGINGLRETARFNPPPRSWSKFMANAVIKHLHGSAEDDVLIAALKLCSLRVPTTMTTEDETRGGNTISTEPKISAAHG
jgi:serine phosphatase RsbU (regulator of sigma subunit)